MCSSVLSRVSVYNLFKYDKRSATNKWKKKRRCKKKKAATTTATYAIFIDNLHMRYGNLLLIAQYANTRQRGSIYVDLIELKQLSIKGKSIDSFSIYVYLIKQYSIDPHYLTLIVY